MVLIPPGVRYLICRDLRCVTKSQVELGIESEFWLENVEQRNVLLIPVRV
jgi:hypothetical protein